MGDTTTTNQCANIDECARSLAPCVADSMCIGEFSFLKALLHVCYKDTVGSYICECNDGFTGNGLDRCIDKDECALGQDTCAENAACINNHGSFECECKARDKKTWLYIRKSLYGIILLLEVRESLFKVGFNHVASNPFQLCLDFDECQNATAYPCGDYGRNRGFECTQ